MCSLKAGIRSLLCPATPHLAHRGVHPPLRQRGVLNGVVKSQRSRKPELPGLQGGGDVSKSPQPFISANSSLLSLNGSVSAETGSTQLLGRGPAAQDSRGHFQVIVHQVPEAAPGFGVIQVRISSLSRTHLCFPDQLCTKGSVNTPGAGPVLSLARSFYHKGFGVKLAAP